MTGTIENELNAAGSSVHYFATKLENLPKDRERHRSELEFRLKRETEHLQKLERALSVEQSAA